MSTGFNWFKEYKIEKDEYFLADGYYKVIYIDGGNTSHSAGNIGKCQDLLEKYGGKRIPYVCEDWIHSLDEKLKLIEPSEMSDMCRKVLETKEIDDVDMRDRIEWFKKLSDEGYYLTYDYE